MIAAQILLVLIHMSLAPWVSAANVRHSMWQSFHTGTPLHRLNSAVFERLLDAISAFGDGPNA
jgi:hypothetical protein